MKGTFKPGDKLIIEKIPINMIKKGDLIIFCKINEDKNDFVVHRVVEITPNGLATLGDNCRDRDREPVIEENIIGMVIKFDRKGKIHKAYNGRLGRFRAMTLHGRLHVTKIIKFFLRKPYLTLRETGFIAKLWRPEIEVIHFETQNGPLIKYVYKGRTVAMCWTEKNHWWYQRPFDFIIKPKQ